MAGGGNERGDLQISKPDPSQHDLIAAAIELGDAARATLGHMPYAGYDAAAQSGTLLLALYDGQVVGYALFGLPRRHVRLTHLCVRPSSRRLGVASRLVEEISRLHADRAGIHARCRRDYELSQLWISLGFTPMGDRPGRGKDRQPLTDWWRDHGHPNLLSVNPESVLVRAAIDMNILRNLVETTRPGHEESSVLVADHLADRLELFRTSALDAEIESVKGPLRAQCLQRAQLLLRPAPRDADRFATAMNLLVADATRQSPEYPASAQDELDLRHVAAAIAANLNVFITADAALTRLLGAEATRQGLRLMRPADVAVRIDELSRAESYRPIDLQSTRYSERLLGSGEDALVESLANTRSGERPRRLLQAIRRLALNGVDRWGVFGPENDLLAVYGTRLADATLEVPVLRVTDSLISQTLVRQLLFRIRQLAVAQSAALVALDAQWLSSTVRGAAIDDGFREFGGRLFTFVLQTVGPASDVEHRAAIAARSAGLSEPAPLRSGMPAIAAAELERIWWPAKILDSELPTYLVPIQQRFSSELLGVPHSLLPRRDNLGLSREHVYYRRPGTQRIEAPGRLLWYMSSGGRSVAESASIVACSQLDSIQTGTPGDLHSRFQHLGVWSLESISEAAPRGLAQAIRFTDTEIFKVPVSRARFRALAAASGVSGTPPQGPRSIPASLFASVYRIGVGL